MNETARIIGERRRVARLLGLDLGHEVIAMTRLTQTRDGATRLEAVRVVAGKRAHQLIGPTTRACSERVVSVQALGEIVLELAEGIHAIAYNVTLSSERSGCVCSGCKTALPCGPIMGLGLALGVPVIPLVHADIRRSLTGRPTACRPELAASLDARIVHFSGVFRRIHEVQRSAFIDATAAALVGFEEMARWRDAVGFMSHNAEGPSADTPVVLPVAAGASR